MLRIRNISGNTAAQIFFLRLRGKYLDTVSITIKKADLKSAFFYANLLRINKYSFSTDCGFSTHLFLTA